MAIHVDPLDLMATAHTSIPDRLVSAFAGRTLLSLDEAAAALDISSRLLRDEVAAGMISFRLCGGGDKKPRRKFGLDDCIEWLHRKRKAECPSIAPKTRPASSKAHSGNMISRSEVYDFQARREKLRSAGRKLSKS